MGRGDCRKHALLLRGAPPGKQPGGLPGGPALPRGLCLGEQVDGDDEAVQTQDLCEDEDQDHADEEPRLLRRPSDAGVAYYPDGVAGCQAGQSYREAGTEMHETPEMSKAGIESGCRICVLQSTGRSA